MLFAVACVVATTTTSIAESRRGTAPAADVPPGVTAGVAVFDRQTGTFTEQLNKDGQFRSASVVKLLIALDHLWNRGPGYSIPAADRARLDPMLRSSDDDAAGHYWSQNGGSAIIDRMVTRLGLTATSGPPAGYPGYWGYTATSAADTVRIYRYLLDSAPAPVRDYVLGRLRDATRCGSDGFDQYGGIPSAFARPWAVKQGWSGFGPSGTCTTGNGTAGNATAGNGTTGTTTGSKPSGPKPSGPKPSGPEQSDAERTDGNRTDGTGTGTGHRPAAGIDLVSHALHTTGTVGPGDRSIVAVFTLHPDGTPYGTAYSALTRLTDSLDIAGAVRPRGGRFGTWGSGVRVRADATTASAAIGTLPTGVEVLVSCQKRGQTVAVPPYTNEWWGYLPQYGGYMTNIYISSPDNKLPGIPDC